MLQIQKKPEGLIFKIFVQPKSSKNKIVGLHGDALKIKITSPPVEGAANQMCIKFLSKALGTPKAVIEIISGQTSRTKSILLKPRKIPFSRQEYKRLKKSILNLYNE
jgi:uncharacterized protein (TIGR00251 family)